jgi:polyisoprenoid-binding protein YceI
MKSMGWGVVGAAALAAAGIAGSAALEAGSEAQVLKIDPQHSNVGFRVRHIFTNVSGSFREFEGSLRFDEKNPAASSVDVTIKAASIDTNPATRTCAAPASSTWRSTRPSPSRAARSSPSRRSKPRSRGS